MIVLLVISSTYLIKHKTFASISAIDTNYMPLRAAYRKMARKLLIWLLFLILIASGVLLYIFSLNIEKNRQEEIADTIKSYFDRQINKQKSQALMLAILLAQNEALKNALLDIDEERGHQILYNALQTLKKYTPLQGVRAQVIAKDLTIFARSWDKEFSGMPLEEFRKDLYNFKITKPKVSIEAGRLLTIKATVPIKNRYKIVGYMESIVLFEPLTKILRKRGVELFVLMDSKYLDVATLMRENPTIGSYVVSNRNYNKPLLHYLKRKKDLLHKSISSDSNYLFITKPMFNAQGEKLGLYLMVVAKEEIRRLASFSKPLLLFLDIDDDELSDIMMIWEHPQSSFRSLYDKSVLEFLSKSEDSELKREFEAEARQILQNYSKEELIDIILNKYRRKPKRGVIQ